jgi:hypothetical protein
MMQLEFGLDSNLNGQRLRTGMLICSVCGERIIISRSGHFGLVQVLGKRGEEEEKTEEERSRK